MKRTAGDSLVRIPENTDNNIFILTIIHVLYMIQV